MREGGCVVEMYWSEVEGWYSGGEGVGGCNEEGV